MITSKRLLIFPASLFLGMMASPNVEAQETLRTWTIESESASIVWIEDLDGDGVRDLIIGNPFHSVGRRSNAGRILAISGAGGAVIRQHIGPTSDYYLGGAVFNVGDIDGDGKQDYGSLAGSPSVAFIFSGADGRELLRRGDGVVSLGSVRAMVSLGDTDGDAREEFAFGASTVVEIYQGGVATPKFVIQAPPEGLFLQFGFSSTTLGDLDGDGIREFAFSAPKPSGVNPFGPGHVYVYSGGTGVLLHDLWRNDEYVYARHGEGMTSPGDLNGDGKDDLAVGSPDGSPPTLDYGGVVRFYDGVTGQIFDEFGAPAQFPGLPNDWGGRISPAGDLNGNGYPDLFVEYYLNFGSRTAAIDGHTKEAFYLFGAHPVPGVFGGLDWNGDDFPDFFHKLFDRTTLVLRSGAPDGVHVVGTPYTTQPGLSPRIGVTGSARPGATVQFHLSRVPPAQAAILVITVESPKGNHVFGGKRFGLPRTVAVRYVQATTVRPGEGVASVALTIPSDPALTGSHFLATWLVQAPNKQILAKTRSLDFEILPGL